MPLSGGWGDTACLLFLSPVLLGQTPWEDLCWGTEEGRGLPGTPPWPLLMPLVCWRC